MTTTFIPSAPAPTVFVPPSSTAARSQQTSSTDALPTATQVQLLNDAQDTKRQLSELSHALQLTKVQLSEHGEAVRAQQATLLPSPQNPEMADTPLPPTARAAYAELFAPGAAAPQATGLDALLQMLGEREKNLDFNPQTKRIQGLQKGMRDMFMQMTTAVEIFANKFAEFSGSVSATATDGNIEADFRLAGDAADEAWKTLRKTVVSVSDPTHKDAVLQGLRAASGLKQFFSGDTTGGGKNLEVLTLTQVQQLLDPVYKALGGTSNGGGSGMHKTSGKQKVSSMKYQEVKSTMDGVSEQLKTRMNQMMDGFSRINEVYDNLMKILTSTYQADADSRKSFLQ